MSKVEEFIAETKLNDLLHKKEAESQKNKVIWVLAIIGAVAAVAPYPSSASPLRLPT